MGCEPQELAWGPPPTDLMSSESPEGQSGQVHEEGGISAVDGDKMILLLFDFL